MGERTTACLTCEIPLLTLTAHLVREGGIEMRDEAKGEKENKYERGDEAVGHRY